jgi:hypothetical protein
MTVLEAAFRYSQLGFSVIPVKGSAYSKGSTLKEKYDNGKTPLIPWAEFQSRIATEQEIQGWFIKWPLAAIALVTGRVSNLCAIDCDSPSAIEMFEGMVGDTFITPIQITPRGGRQYICAYHESIPTKVELAPKLDARGEGGYFLVAPSVNSPNGSPKQYEWEDGFDILTVPVAEVPPEFVSLALASNNKSFSLSLYREDVDSLQGSTSDDVYKSPQSLQLSTKFFTEGRRDNDLFHVANALVKGNADPQIRASILQIIARHCDPPFPERDIPAKIQSALDRAKRRERNLAAEVEEFLLSTTGEFLSTEIENRLQLSTREEKKNLSIILKRLSQPPKQRIRKVGTRNGYWATIDETIEFMDFVNVDLTARLSVELPLDIHKKTVFFPKSVIVLAGVTGYGKTTLALDFIRNNMGRHDIYYWNSEMSPEALNKKLSYFNSPPSPEHWNMKAIPGEKWDHTNIGDKVFPDAINVIDYLEPEGEKPYGIHAVISSIINRLNKGMAFITVQKKPGAKLGTGGIYSAKAASLYLSLEWGTIEVIKNRFREEDKYPNLNCIEFEIKPGCNFVAKGGWHSEESKKKEAKYGEFVHEN